MDLYLKWHRHLFLQDASLDNGIYNVAIDRIPESAGIYMFLRVFGSKHEALYVGKAISLRRRIEQQLNNVRLMKGIENSMNGRKMLVFAEFKARPGQQLEPSLQRIESALIRHYLADGQQLLNIKGARIVSHSLTSERQALKKFIPGFLHFEQ